MNAFAYDYDLPPGSVGAFVEDLPVLTTAHVRPHVIAILLHRGAVRTGEVLASITPHCQIQDLKVGEWSDIDEDYHDRTRAEAIVGEVLGELVSEGLLRFSVQEDLWVLTTNDIPRIISWVAATGGRMPQHVLLDLSYQNAQRPVIVAVDIPWDGTDIEPSPAGRLTCTQGTNVVDDEYVACYHKVDPGA